MTKETSSELLQDMGHLYSDTHQRMAHLVGSGPYQGHPGAITWLPLVLDITTA